MSSLPTQIKQLKTLRRLSLKKNLLDKLPVEIDTYDVRKVIEYYLSLQEGKKPLNEAKMLIVGQANVGKTCLRKRLIEGNYQPHRNKTDGIDIEDWHIEINDKQLQVNIWDFGGQEIYHSTHQFFLTKRSLYILVLDTTLTEQENRIEYWLKIIRSFGEDSPVVVVANKVDQHPLDIAKHALQTKYRQIQSFWEVSCQTGEGITELNECIQQEIYQLEHINDLLPLSWFNVKDKLEELDKDYIVYEKYEQLCENENIKKTNSQSILIELLHDLGIILNFQDDARLIDTHVLNPEWVTNGVYKILNDRKLIVDDRGILGIKELQRILDLKRYPKTKHLFIISMMRKFELCFPLESEKEYLIPDILQKEELYTGEWNKALTFEYHYPVYINSIISRFMVRMNHYIYRQTYWRTGVVLFNEGNIALVTGDQEDKIIRIRVKGNTTTRRCLLKAIRSQFDYIHRSISGLYVEEKIRLIEHPLILIDYQELLAQEEMGKEYYTVGKLKKDIPLNELLDGIETKSDRLLS